MDDYNNRDDIVPEALYLHSTGDHTYAINKNRTFQLLNVNTFVLRMSIIYVFSMLD